MLCINVRLKLHQHRRLTRAQSHHGSEEEKKRRKILARKVSSRLSHTRQYKETSWHLNINMDQRLSRLLLNFATRQIILKAFNNYSWKNKLKQYLCDKESWDMLSLLKWLLTTLFSNYLFISEWGQKPTGTCFYCSVQYSSTSNVTEEVVHFVSVNNAC